MVVLPGDAPGSCAYKAYALSVELQDNMEVPVRFELTVRVLQTHAFPLGYGIITGGLYG